MPVEEQFEEIEGARTSRETASLHRRSFFLAAPMRFLRACWNHVDFFVMLLLMAFVAKYYLSQRMPLFIVAIEFFDTSWALDLIDKAHRGIWLGKDAIFTRGPLFQWLLSWGPLRQGASLGSFYLYLWVFQFWTTILTLYGIGAILLRRQPSWVRAFYLLVLLIFWVPVHWIIFNVKFLLPLCSFAVFLRMFPDRGTSFSGRCWRAAVAASLIAVAFLLSDDSGFYTAAAFVVVLAASVFYEHSSSDLRAAAKYAMLTTGFFAVWVLAINGATGNVFDFHFWRGVYEVATQYRWAQSMYMQPPMTPIFWLAVGLNALAFFAQWLVYRKTPGVSLRARRDWLAMLGFVLIGLQLILVCAEKLHVATGLFPWIAFSFALLLGATENKLSTLRLAVGSGVILLVTGIFSGPNHLFIPDNVLQDRSAITSVHHCPQGLHEIDGVCVQVTDYVGLRRVRDYLVQHSSDSDSVGIFPYQSVYAFVARRRVAGELIQHYISAGDYLNRRQMQSLEQARPAWAIYAAEPWQSSPLNGVSNFTRTPYIWLYWQRWYSDDFDALPGLLILRRDEERGKQWKMTSTSVLAHPVQAPGSEEVVLPASSLGDELDFIKIDVKVEYPLWWRLLRPSNIVIRLRLENGEEKTLNAIAQPNHPYEIWIYPWEQAQLANYFSSSPAQWRLGARPRIQGLSLRSLPMDWIAVQPSRITIQDVQVVKLSE